MIKAFITGIAGQDGSYMAELLLRRGYEVHGMVRRTSFLNDRFIKNLDITVHEGDMADPGTLTRLIKEIQPDEVYNFAAMAGVGPSFFQPEYALEIGGLGVLRLLEAIRHYCPKAKFFQASSSHIFGDTPVSPQSEITPLQPISPYGIAKAMGHLLVHQYRTNYGIHACSGIFYAHASPRYSEGFLLSKIVHAVRRIKKREQETLELGDLSTEMDFGYAKEYMEAAYNLMQLEDPTDLIIATGKIHTAEEFMKTCFDVAGLDYKKHVKYNKDLKRPSEVSVLVGDISKARMFIQFEPKVKFRELIEMMYEPGEFKIQSIATTGN